MTTTDDDPLERLERQLGRLLVTGVVSSAVCLAVGLALLMVSSEPVWADRLLAAGLVILMATPMLRVVVSVIEYVRIREWFFVLTTLIVLTELVAGVLYAWHR
ncbi:MAG: DUF1634 domain-containing protein, partial [Vicinamibacterales bacterium]